MIRINDDWVIDVDDYNYTLKRDMHKVIQRKQKDGTYINDNVYATKGHFSSLDKALKRLGDEIVRERLKGSEIDLHTAVMTIRECMDEWNRITEKILEKET